MFHYSSFQASMEEFFTLEKQRKKHAAKASQLPQSYDDFILSTVPGPRDQGQTCELCAST